MSLQSDVLSYCRVRDIPDSRRRSLVCSRVVGRTQRIRRRNRTIPTPSYSPVDPPREPMQTLWRPQTEVDA
ncbi:hypothetical protein D8S78_09390 [Natrialba swarupiae]|nr:hypothetical protein [Natrialba swarupiae]